MAPEERTFARQCLRNNPPSANKRNYYPTTAPRMIRRPIGGDLCKYSLLNVRGTKSAIRTHFNIAHRNGCQYRKKIEGNNNHFLYTTYPLTQSSEGAPDGGSFAALRAASAEHPAARRRQQQIFPRLAPRGAGGPFQSAPETNRRTPAGDARENPPEKRPRDQEGAASAPKTAETAPTTTERPPPAAPAGIPAETREASRESPPEQSRNQQDEQELLQTGATAGVSEDTGKEAENLPQEQLAQPTPQ